MSYTVSVKAIILSAGLATRLNEISQTVPKALLPICGTTIIERIIGQLVKNNITEIVVNTHHLGDKIKEKLGDGSSYGAKITYLEEEKLLGTGGSIKAAEDLLKDGDEPILSINGKLIFDFDFEGLLKFHKARKSEATLALREDNEMIWGTGIAVGGRGNIVSFLGDNVGPAPTIRNLMFTGIQIFNPEFIDRIPDSDNERCIARTAGKELFNEGKLYGYISRDYWWECSTEERYLQAINDILDQKDRSLSDLTSYVDESAKIDSSAKIDKKVWIGKNVQIKKDVVIGPFTQICDNAVIEDDVSIKNAVVFENTIVKEKKIYNKVVSA